MGTVLSAPSRRLRLSRPRAMSVEAPSGATSQTRTADERPRSIDAQLERPLRPARAARHARSEGHCPSTATRRHRDAGRVPSPRRALTAPNAAVGACRLQAAQTAGSDRGFDAVVKRLRAHRVCPRGDSGRWPGWIGDPSARPLGVQAVRRDGLLHVLISRGSSKNPFSAPSRLAAKNRTHSCKKPIAGRGRPSSGLLWPQGPINPRTGPRTFSTMRKTMSR